MADYYEFKKSEFESKLKHILVKNRIGFMSNITSEWIKQGNFTKEIIYKVTTKNKSVDIIIFSSIDYQLGKVRKNGADRVRVILRWTTKNGNVYQKVNQHNRVENLFTKLEETLLGIQPNVFNLKYSEFSPTIK